ncbi:hypothetical protein GU3_08565 [Oceanimonas sp. GK1]|uniref:DUF4376 domain-containing protein n=1 Tax=Oceanimonas sp. (strain GK1 / IBRC-M 10197) TaxID=511062 RepID=UPI0002495376|nr:DUF4376 domain-containing protein [Oceanimonas sp. GK1]AEY01469.1 hypothetical protein GU3_08565 [Oceanimonas sp. GK1]
MNYYYSPFFNGFYPEFATAPEDATPCPRERYLATRNPPLGKIRQPGADGLPELVDDPAYQPPGLADYVANKHAEINTWRDSQELLPVEHAGYRWDADPTSRARIESVLLAGAMPLDYWTDADNTDRPMTLEQLRALYAAIVQQGGRIHDRQRQMKTEVATLTTIEAVQAYPVGWPIEEPA